MCILIDIFETTWHMIWFIWFMIRTYEYSMTYENHFGVFGLEVDLSSSIHWGMSFQEINCWILKLLQESSNGLFLGNLFCTIQIHGVSSPVSWPSYQFKIPEFSTMVWVWGDVTVNLKTISRFLVSKESKPKWSKCPNWKKKCLTQYCERLRLFSFFFTVATFTILDHPSTGWCFPSSIAIVGSLSVGDVNFRTSM